MMGFFYNTRYIFFFEKTFISKIINTYYIPNTQKNIFI